MNIYPVLIDSQPEFLGRPGESASLLLSPLGTATLIEHVLSRFDATLSQHAPVVVSPGAGAGYRHRINAVCPGARVVDNWTALADALAACEPSDALLIIDPTCLPIDVLEFQRMCVPTLADPRWSIHLVAFEKGVGTKELVNCDSAGRVRRIQRYYDAVTWPFITGVAALLLPVASGILSDLPASASLWELRGQLSDAGVPSRDLAIVGGAHDLATETGFLAASERFIVDATAGRGGSGSFALSLFLGTGHNVHPTARLIGPVIVHGGAIIEENARVVGPALIGPGARVGAGAVVAQVCVGAHCVIPPRNVIRHRVLFAEPPADHAPSWQPPPTAIRGGRVQASEPAPHDAAIQSGRAAYLAVKRALDIVAAVAAVVVLIPLLAVIALLIQIDSRGPIFYRHEREGRRGRRFPCWKFRTMHEGAAARQRELQAANLMDGPQFKIVRDPRTTRVGRLLRAANVDEIPQLVNVVLGDMSLVGPRPSPFRENQYCVPWREARLSVRPGITGLWQVCRHDRDISDFHQWIEYDLLYIRNASLWLDMKILAATILTVGGKWPVPRSWIVSRPVTADTAQRAAG